MAKVLANPEIIIAESELFGTSNGNEDNRDALNRLLLEGGDRGRFGLLSMCERNQEKGQEWDASSHRVLPRHGAWE